MGRFDGVYPLSPRWGFGVVQHAPTAYAVGYFLAPLTRLAAVLLRHRFADRLIPTIAGSVGCLANPKSLILNRQSSILQNWRLPRSYVPPMRFLISFKASASGRAA